jgi:phage/plasmid-like protein (TIGR03299 family)
VSKKIWYNFGSFVPKTTKTSLAAMQKANLSWEVESRQIQIVDGQVIDGKVAIVRKDTNQPLGIVTSTYKSIQNTQVFSFLDHIVQRGDATFYAAGYIGKGEKIWLLLKLNKDISLPSNDTIQKFILFSNAHDGRGAIRAYFFPLRSKTETALNISFGKRVEQGIQMRHVGNVKTRIDEASKIFKLSEIFYEKFEDAVNNLYKSKFSTKKVDLFLSNSFENYSFDSTRTKNTFEKIKTQYEKEITTFPSSADSAWAWFNSIVNFIDYERLSKGKDNLERVSNHLESLFWGSALLLKQKAWNSVSTLIKL